jgi:hypothetical protein
MAIMIRNMSASMTKLSLDLSVIDNSPLFSVPFA